MTTWLDHIPDELKPERWPNLKEAATKAYMGQTAVLGKRAWLVVGYDGELYDLEAENGERMKALNFLVSDFQSDNNRVVAASRIEGSPLGRGMKLADCGCTVDKLDLDQETGEWSVKDANGEPVSLDNLIERLDEMDWLVDDSVATPEKTEAHAVIGGDYDSLVDTAASCPNCGSENIGIDEFDGMEAWCEDCGYAGSSSEFEEFEPDAMEVGLSSDPYEDDWQSEAKVAVNDDEDISDREDNPEPLKCPNCGSHTVKYVELKQGDLSTFHCLACGNSFKHDVIVNQKKKSTVIVTDSDGAELRAGAYYTLHGARYKVPDVIKVTEIRDGVVFAMVEENPHPLTITASDVEDQGYSFEPLPINGTRTADFNFEGVSWAPEGVPARREQPDVWRDDTGPWHSELREIGEQAAPELIQTPGGGSLWIQKDASGYVTGWSVPGADGQPGQFSSRDLEKVQAMVDANQFGFRETPEPFGTNESVTYEAATKEGLGIPDTADDHDKLFSDVIKALGYKRITLETNDKIREFVNANSPADLKNVAHASDQWREIVSSLASSYLEDMTDGDMDAPGDMTLSDLGIPEGDAEDYWRDDDKVSKEARRKFTPGEQKKFIEEEGEARNRHKLRLEDSHYIDTESSVDDDDDNFLF